MHPGQICDDPGQQIGRDGRDQSDAQPARKPVARGAREITEFIDRAQDIADAPGEFFSEPRERDLSCASLQQQAAERFLHFLDLHRERRLRDSAGFRGPSEMAVPRQRIEIAELAKGHVDHKIILS